MNLLCHKHRPGGKRDCQNLHLDDCGNRNNHGDESRPEEETNVVFGMNVNKAKDCECAYESNGIVTS